MCPQFPKKKKRTQQSVTADSGIFSLCAHKPVAERPPNLQTGLIMIGFNNS